MSDTEAVGRAAARASWPGGKYRLGEEPSDDLLTQTTAAERLAMMWRLAQDAWVLSGRTIPDYARAQAPGRVTRAGDPRPE